MTTEDFLLPEDNLTTGSFEAQRKAVMKSFEDKDFAKKAFQTERERLMKVKERAQTFADPNDKSAAQFDFDYIVDEAVREINALDEAEPMIESDIEAAGAVFMTARLKRIELDGLLARVRGLQP